jgi:hypothetical protein
MQCSAKSLLRKAYSFCGEVRGFPHCPFRHLHGRRQPSLMFRYILHSITLAKPGRPSTYGPSSVTVSLLYDPMMPSRSWTITSKLSAPLSDRPLANHFSVRSVTNIRPGRDLDPCQVVGQSLESWVGPTFKLIAYAFILLHADGLPFVAHL